MYDLQHHCPQCGRLVGAADRDYVCPRCGWFNSAENLAPTLDLADLSSAGRISALSPQGETFPKRLLGRRFGAYDIESLLGKGGMAWVFLARHNALHRPCAIKVLCPELLGCQSNLLDLFVAEARAAASLVHPHIVAIHNVGELDSHHFIEMEFVPGRSLEQLVSERHPLSISEATGYLLQSCSALTAAHRRGLVHRDFKPANILVRSDGTAKLADFGLAKTLAPEPVTADGGLAGTPQFMAPELFHGEHADQQSDVYAVGVSYFYALTGQFPFAQDTIGRLAQAHAEQPIPDPRSFRRDIPAGAAAIIARCLAKDPRDRYPESGILFEELQCVFNGMRDFPTLVTTALTGMDVECQAGAGQVVATVRLAGGRTQRVHIEDRPAQADEPRLIRIYSTCAPINRFYFRKALEFNAVMPHCALAVEEIDGAPHFVMLNCHLHATCDAEDIRRSVQQVALWADHVEEALTGKDIR